MSASSAPISYAIVAGSTKEGSSGSNSPSPVAGSASPVTEAAAPAVAPAATAAPSTSAASSSSTTTTTTATTDNNEDEGKESKTGSSGKSSSNNSNATATTASEKKAPASFTPAPVPVVNAWAKGSVLSASSSQSQSAASSQAPSRRESQDGTKNGKPLDPTSWPKPDEKIEPGRQRPAGPTTGKDKWQAFSNNGQTPKNSRPQQPQQQHAPASSNHQRQQGRNTNNQAKNVPNGNGMNGRKGHVKQHSGNINYKNSNAKVMNGNGQKKDRSPVVGQSAPFKNDKRFNQRTDENGNHPQQHHNHHNNNHQQQQQQHHQPGFRHHNNNNNNNNNNQRGGFRPYNQQRPMHFNNQKPGFFIPGQEFMYAAGAPPMMQQPMASHYDAQLGMVIAQVEYYLSVENLCKDIFLRRQMNSQGLLPLSLIASFNRVKQMTNGNQDLLFEACRWSPSAEMIGSKIRPRIGWDNWVLPVEDRLENGKDETDGGKPDNKLEFDAAAAQPFVPKTDA